MAVALDKSLGSTNGGSGGVGSMTHTTTQAVAAGGKILLAVGHYRNTVSSVTGGGLTWSKVGEIGNGNNYVTLYTADAPSGLASGTTVTINFSASNTLAPQACAASFTGVATGTGNDGGVKTATGTGAWAAGSITTTQGGDLIVGVSKGGAGADPAETPNAGFTELYDFGYGSGDSTCFIYQVQGSAGAINPGGDWGGGVSWAAVGVALKAATATDHPLNASPGSYAISGTASKPVADRVVGAAPGSYALTGNAAAVPAGRAVLASPAAYAITGDAALLPADRVLGAAPGVYTLTGAAATLGNPTAFTLAADPGAFTLTGLASALPADRAVQAAPGSFALTGDAAGLLAARVVSTVPGSYGITGDAAALPAARVVLAAPGAYTLDGIAADLALPGAYALDAAPGAYVLTGDAAGTLAARKVDAAPGSYALTGDAVGSALERVLLAGPGSLALTGAAAALAAALAARIGTVVQADAATASVALADTAPTLTLAEAAGTVALSDRIST